MPPQLIIGMIAINRKLVRWAADDSTDPWSLGNQVLYDLCASHPRHRDDRVIVAKVWLVGRAYSAAVERRKTRRDPATMGDRFYTQVIAPGIAASGIDDWLSGLPVHSDSEGALASALLIHGKLVELFRQLTGMEKRSLASKYLHFHRPDVFLLYDERAARATRRLSWGRDQRRPPPVLGSDAVHHLFCHRSSDTPKPPNCFFRR